MSEFLAGSPIPYLIVCLAVAVSFFFIGYFSGVRRGIPARGAGPSQFGNDAAILKLVVEHAHEGLVMQDIYGRIEWTNPAYSRITGYTAEEIRGRRPQEFILAPESQVSPEEIETFKFDLTKYQSGFEELIHNRRKNGEYFWNQLTFAVVEGKTLEDSKIIVICRDVTSKVEYMEELEVVRNTLKYQAEHDDLTGIANRAKLSSFLQETVSAANETGRQVGIIHFDLDHFKEINDSHGHSVGDAVLQHAAHVLKSVLGDKGLAARTGGDEFIAVVSEPCSREQMQSLGNRILDGLAKPVKVDSQSLKVSVSVGLVLADGAKSSASELINCADMALYAAKKTGRSRIAWYTEALGAAHRQKRMTMAQLDEDLETGRLTLLLEPQYSFEHRRIIGYEAFACWLHPSRGLVDPVEMLSSQEDVKHIAKIEHFALRRGIAEIKRLRETSTHPFFLSVNLTGASLKDPGFRDAVEELCDENMFARQDIVIELDEKIIRLNESDGLADHLGKISELGCQIALDKFGSGHGGAGQLIHLNADGLKISRLLIAGLRDGTSQQQLVESIIRLAATLGLKTSAVGVDTQEQAEILRKSGCGVIQGEVISKPLTPREAETHIRDFVPQFEMQ
ncbi:putative bifunctional diguanylate cyclase/phosphodiesterase [Roseibium marinum]|uniref:PAS domain S-box-containing protein/diguanylate cyclase (GGDEF)-like protein n=1 Tax=Roseibium marinum TaxID=281252 RepID=A0A2S3UQH2_9HYPH|nr:EAL domain-containing protein [Roseibium marinum]POF29820.1 PAS domain S-box-containing protein/diguanylate cyclase (GGDEF)-like protein [Roseibium marinum]